MPMISLVSDLTLEVEHGLFLTAYWLERKYYTSCIHISFHSKSISDIVSTKYVNIRGVCIRNIYILEKFPY